LQRERYYELLQAQTQAAVTQNSNKGGSEKAEEVLIRYPNPDAPLPLPEQAN